MAAPAKVLERTLERLRPDAEKRKREIGRAMPGLIPYLREVYPDFEEELARLRPPLWWSPINARAMRARGHYFDVDAVDRFLRFCQRVEHIKGRRWAGRPFEPELFQIVYIIAPLFGWLREDGRRVFTVLWEEVPRKNGKSTLAAAIGLYLLSADGEPGAELYSVAGKEEQARFTFDPASEMAKRSPALRKRLNVKSKAISFEKVASSWKLLAGEPDDAESNMGANAHGLLIDEVHAHKSRAMIDTMETSTGSRDQPITVFMTTAGLDDPESIYTEKSDYAEKVARGDVDDESFLTVIYRIPEGMDWRDPEAIEVANPGLDITVRREYLERKRAEAEVSLTARNTYLRLHLNRRVGAVSSFIALEYWDRHPWPALFPDEELLDRPAFGGLDLSSTVDLTGAVFVVPDDEGIFDVVVRAWTPLETIEKREERDKAPYRQWIEEGHLIGVDGEAVDYDNVEDEIITLGSADGGTLDLERLGFDRWGSKQLINHLMDAGLEVYEMGQGYASMSHPTKLLEKLILQGKIRHRLHPVLRWCIANLAVETDAAGNLKPSRKRSKGRIDLAVALIMALDAWDRATGGGSVYEDQDLVVA